MSYVTPEKSWNFCQGNGLRYGYTQNKAVCWMMNKHTGQHGCKRCPNTPQNLGIRFTILSLRKADEKGEPILNILPPKTTPLDVQRRIKTGPQKSYRISIPAES